MNQGPASSKAGLSDDTQVHHAAPLALSRLIGKWGGETESEYPRPLGSHAPHLQNLTKLPAFSMNSNAHVNLRAELRAKGTLEPKVLSSDPLG